MPTEWREGKEKFKRRHVGDDQLLKDTQERDIFFKDTHLKASDLVPPCPEAEAARNLTSSPHDVPTNLGTSARSTAMAEAEAD